MLLFHFSHISEKASTDRLLFFIHILAQRLFPRFPPFLVFGWSFQLNVIRFPFSFRNCNNTHCLAALAKSIVRTNAVTTQR